MKIVIQIVRVSILFYLAIFFSCKTKDSISTKNVFEKASKNDSLSYYFPSILNDTVERSNPDYKDFSQKWYSSSLYSFKEPVLYTKNDSQTIYRLLWLRSFHKPVCFVMKEFKDKYFFNAKTLDRQPSFTLDLLYRGKDSSGKEIIDTTGKGDRFALVDFDTIIVLTTGQWKQIQNYLAKLNFWQGPVAEPNDEQSTDGANWIIEGRKDNQYHFINRRNYQNELTPFGKYLIKLSGLNIKDDEIY